MPKQHEPNQPAARPSFREVAPLWAAISDQYTTLCTREDEILERLREIKEAQEMSPDPKLGTVDIIQPPKAPPPPPAAVVQLLGRFATKPSSPAAEPEPTVVYHRKGDAEHTGLAAEMEYIRTAKELLWPQWQAAHTEGSKTYCDLYRAEYEEVATGVCSALVELSAAMVKYRKLIDSFVADGADYSPLRTLDFATLHRYARICKHSWHGIYKA